MLMKFEVDGEEYAFDNEKLMFSEAMAVQQQAGMTTEELGKLASAGDTAAIGATIWVAVLRKRSLEKGVSFRQAAEQWPFADFDFDMNSLVVLAGPGNPTGAQTAGPETPTSPGISEPSTAATRSASRKSTTARSSRTTSESAPGSGTS